MSSFGRWLFIVGIVLATPFFVAYLRRPVDEVLAQSGLKAVRLQDLSPRSESTIGIRIPNSSEWTRIRKQWGDPPYIVSIASQLKAKDLRSFDNGDLTVWVADGAGNRIATKTAEGAPYGYSAECTQTGILLSWSSSY